MAMTTAIVEVAIQITGHRFRVGIGTTFVVDTFRNSRAPIGWPRWVSNVGDLWSTPTVFIGTPPSGAVGVETRVGSSVTSTAAGNGTDDALEIDLDGGAAPSDLNAWIERVAPDAQLVIVAGPPLANSIDTALLACASDGLVIVAESEVTDRNALQLAAERARIAGCRTLGVVMHGTQERMPVWMRRLMGSPTNDAPRED